MAVAVVVLVQAAEAVVQGVVMVEQVTLAAEVVAEA